MEVDFMAFLGAFLLSFGLNHLSQLVGESRAQVKRLHRCDKCHCLYEKRAWRIKIVRTCPHCKKEQ